MSTLWDDARLTDEELFEVYAALGISSDGRRESADAATRKALRTVAAMLQQDSDNPNFGAPIFRPDFMDGWRAATRNWAEVCREEAKHDKNA